MALLWAIWDEEDYMVQLVLIRQHKRSKTQETEIELPLSTLLDNDGKIWDALEEHLDRSFLETSWSVSWSWRSKCITELPQLLERDWASCIASSHERFLDWEYASDEVLT